MSYICLAVDTNGEVNPHVHHVLHAPLLTEKHKFEVPSETSFVSVCVDGS